MCSYVHLIASNYSGDCLQVICKLLPFQHSEHKAQVNSIMSNLAKFATLKYNTDTVSKPTFRERRENYV